MAIDEANLADQASALLRRWLAETHTTVEPGALELVIGSIRLRTEVTYRSPTGAHGFGPLHVLGSSGEPVAVAEPGLLAALCGKDARARGAAVAAADGWSAAGPLDGVASSMSDPGEAKKWITSQVDDELLPRLPTGPRTDADDLTAALLTRRVLAAIGTLGRRGVADESELLGALSQRLHAVAEQHPAVEWLVGQWLTKPTVADVAVVNPLGSGSWYEIPNPLRPLNISDPVVPGVPMPELGPEWSIRPVEVGDGEPGADVELVHRWMNRDHVASTWLQAWPLDRWRAELARQLAGEHSLPCLVSHGGRQVGYVELYRVARDKLAECYPYHPRDLGVHIAIGEPDAVGRGLGSGLLRSIATGLLAADHECDRVVAEPDVHNGASIAAFGKAGFSRVCDVGLPSKNAALLSFAR